jgi:hypothetical protein
MAEQLTVEQVIEMVLVGLKRLPPGFRWVFITGNKYTRDELVARIEGDPDFGKLVTPIISGFDLALPKDSKLGKRYQCLVCGTVTLCTKAGQGSIYCHDQEMLLAQPRPLPSSD